MTDVISDEVANFNWLLNNFVETSAGVCDAVAVSSDGLLMAMSRTLDRASAEQVAAILGRGAARAFGFDPLQQVVVAMDGGYLFVSSISDGSCIGVVATRNCDAGLVGYQTSLLLERASGALTPALVSALRSAVLR
jgi:predicted regulator of Ras-like GTPase activity (Roadblock/LC7/MglB family)